MLRDLFSLFPAYAGVILSRFKSQSEEKTFPRIRGGDPKRRLRDILVSDFSPHTRG